jgi:glycosyltransferase involved in cell wall biosynthesis
MACGTPAIAFRKGALPEVIVHGETGLIVDSVDEMATAIQSLPALNPRACRTHVEMNHSAARMASDYEALYDRILLKMGSQNSAHADAQPDSGIASTIQS